MKKSLLLLLVSSILTNNYAQNACEMRKNLKSRIDKVFDVKAVIKLEQKQNDLIWATVSNEFRNILLLNGFDVLPDNSTRTNKYTLSINYDFKDKKYSNLVIRVLDFKNEDKNIAIFLYAGVFNISDIAKAVALKLKPFKQKVSDGGLTA